MTSLSLNKHQP